MYRRFPDRESLIEALFAEQVEAVVATARSAALVDDPWDGLVTFLTQVIHEQSSQPRASKN